MTTVTKKEVTKYKEQNKTFKILSDSIKQLVTELGEHPYDINNGLCDQFAETIEERVRGARAEWGDEEDHPFAPSQYPEDHCYIVYKGRYYDAEEPYGMDCPTKLPIFQRQVIVHQSQ